MNVVLAFLLAAVVCVHAIQDDDVLRQWSEFQTTHAKSYRSPVEARKRFGIFRDNLNEIEQHNSLYEQGKSSYKKGVNEFADWTKDEFVQYVNKGRNARPTVVGTNFNGTQGFVAPKSVDWRSKSAVTGVKKQGGCEAGWAFSATGALEGQLGIRGNLISLSEQNLIDCSGPQGNTGCLDGMPINAFQYMKKYGIASESDYPYEENTKTCRASSHRIAGRIYYIYTVEAGNDAALIEAVASKGPVAVSIDATFELQMYTSGILNDLTCSRESSNHAVLLIGYGTENGKKYYLLKNSWGTLWGEHGYFRLSRSRKNECGIASSATYPY